MHKPSSRDDEGIVPYEFYEGSRNNWGIATPVCGLVRNDIVFSGVFFFVKILQKIAENFSHFALATIGRILYNQES